MDNSNMIQRIEIRLKEMGKSKSEFYRETGISSATYSQWNTGQFGPSKRKLEAISAYTGIPMSDLTGEEQKEKPPAQGEGPMYPEWYGKLTPEETEQVRKYAEFLIAERHKDQP